ncbi:MAG: NAD(P)/FAD-dependent oxidoreductase [Oceanococcus sp.]
MHKHKVVIVGGGFGGLFAARALGGTDYDVTLLDKRNFHLFQPLLYQVATGILTVGDISAQQRVVLRKRRNVRTLMSTVYDIDPDKQVIYHERGELPYDTLIVATGVKHQYFGNDNWRHAAPGLKTIEHALEMRHRIFRAFELAEAENDPERRRRLLNFVVVGGGPTGVELAGALGELSQRVMVGDFRAIDSRDAKITLIEGADRVLPVFNEKLSAKAQRYLEELGVEVRTRTMVKDIGAGRVHLQCGDETETLQAETVLWAAGVEVSAFGRLLAKRTQAETDRGGRFLVSPGLSISSHDNIHVLGDLGHFVTADGKTLPGLAPVAIQQGQYMAKKLKRDLKGKPSKGFRYFDKGSMAIIGRYRVVGQISGIPVTGFTAWFLWAVVHVWSLIEPGQRLSVTLHWLWRFMGRTADRLITGNPPKTSEILKAHGIDPKTFEKAE